MALKPTIYKLKIALADTDREYYDDLNLTVAQHPSETLERMMARVLAYCLNAQEYLVFTKGLCAVEEPDLWVRTLDDRIALWIDVGEPSVERIKKAARITPRVKVYCFNSKADTWWGQGESKFKELAAAFYQFQWSEMQALALLVKRTMAVEITISGDTAYIAAENGECAVSWKTLQQQ